MLNYNKLIIVEIKKIRSIIFILQSLQHNTLNTYRLKNMNNSIRIRIILNKEPKNLYL